MAADRRRPVRARRTHARNHDPEFAPEQSGLHHAVELERLGGRRKLRTRLGLRRLFRRSVPLLPRHRPSARPGIRSAAAPAEGGGPPDHPGETRLRRRRRAAGRENRTLPQPRRCACGDRPRHRLRSRRARSGLERRSLLSRTAVRRGRPQGRSRSPERAAEERASAEPLRLHAGPRGTAPGQEKSHSPCRSPKNCRKPSRSARQPCSIRRIRCRR